MGRKDKMTNKLRDSAIVVGAGVATAVFIVFWIITTYVRQEFRVCVDYGKSLQEMVQEGQYNCAQSIITQGIFSVQGEGRKKVKIRLFSFNRSIHSDEVIAEMEKAGFRPARIEELLALGAQRPALQKKFPIACLGSVYDEHSVPVLDWSEAGQWRFMGLCWDGHGWEERWRFAAVRRIDS